MNKQQEVILGMLKEIHDVCTKNGIDYSIGAGTLLGGCRNHGFIYWDDDADIWMTLDNYKKFREVCKTQLPENRMLRSPEIQEEYWHHLAHYTATDTTCFHRCEAYLQDLTAGEVIDIFILDPISDDPEERKAYLKDLGLYASVLSYGYVVGERWEPDVEEFDYYTKLIDEVGKTEVARILEEKLATHFSEDGECYMCRYTGYPSLFKRSTFEKYTLVRFEDTELMAPWSAEDCFISVYGDEWVNMPFDPPLVKHNTASSIEVPCKDALEYYTSSDSLSALKREELVRRRLVLETAPTAHYLEDERCRMRAKVAELELKKHLEECKDEYERASAAKDGIALADILNDYLDFQLRPDMLGRRSYAKTRRFYNPILVDVEPSVFEDALIALLSTERLDRLMCLLQAWEDSGRNVTDYMKSIKEAVQTCRLAFDDHQHGDYDAGLAKAEQVLSAFPTIDSFMKLNCYLTSGKWKQEQTKEALAALNAAACEGRAQFPEDGFYLKYLADVAAAKDGVEALRDTYIEAAETTLNGIVLYDIKELIGYSPRWHHQSAWAEMAGLEPYERDEVEEANPIESAQKYQQIQFELLCELVDICNEHEIDYVLSRKTAIALFVHNELPQVPENYAILCSGKNMRKLKSILENELTKNREFSTRIGRKTGGLRALYYGNPDTLLLNMKSYFVRDKSGLSVSVLRNISRGGFSYISKSMKNNISRFTNRDSVEEEFAGHVFKVPKSLDNELASHIEREHSEVTNTAENPYFVFSADIPYKEFFETGALDMNYFTVKDSIENKNLRKKAIFARMNHQYCELKCAVSLKEVSINLLPKRPLLESLYEKKDFIALSEELKDYIELANTYEYLSKKHLCFDNKIYAIMQATRSELEAISDLRLQQNAAIMQADDSELDEQ